jgi:hypothetical protein
MGEGTWIPTLALQFETGGDSPEHDITADTVNIYLDSATSLTVVVVAKRHSPVADIRHWPAELSGMVTDTWKLDGSVTGTRLDG